MQGGAVTADEVDVVAEERAQPSTVALAQLGGQRRARSRRGELGPEHRVEVKCPTVVVVDAPALAVGVPAVVELPAGDRTDTIGDLGVPVRPADAGEELLDDR